MMHGNRQNGTHYQGKRTVVVCDILIRAHIWLLQPLPPLSLLQLLCAKTRRRNRR